jgi:hypothetical protein
MAEAEARPAAIARALPSAKPAAAAARVAQARPAPSKPKSDAQSVRLAVAELTSSDPDKSASRAALARGDWIVQVGAFRAESQAKDRLGQVARKWSSLFRRSDGLVTEGGGHYRARFTGFDAEGAKEACRMLSGKGEPCMALRAA